MYGAKVLSATNLVSLLLAHWQVSFLGKRRCSTVKLKDRKAKISFSVDKATIELSFQLQSIYCGTIWFDEVDQKTIRYRKLIFGNIAQHHLFLRLSIEGPVLRHAKRGAGR